MEEAPRYRLDAPLYAEDVLWPMGKVIEFDGMPNETMSPLNQPARDRMRTFVAGLNEGKTPDVADVMFEAMAARPRHDQIPLTGTVKIAGAAIPEFKEPKTKIIEEDDSAQTPIKLGGKK